MIKHYCDKCQEEFTLEYNFIEYKEVIQRSYLIPQRKGQPQPGMEVKVETGHLCPLCRSLFLKWLDKGK